MEKAIIDAENNSQRGPQNNYVAKMQHSMTSTDIPNFIQIAELFVDRWMYARTLRLALLI